jgi:hypothetical protein
MTKESERLLRKTSCNSTKLICVQLRVHLENRAFSKLVFATFMTESQTSAFVNWVSIRSNAANTLELLHLEYQDYGLNFITPDQYVWTYS